MKRARLVGQEAVEKKGWLRTHKWLILRRSSQFSIIGLFLLWPLAEIHFIQGNLNASLILDLIPLTDPFLASQVLMAGLGMEYPAMIGLAVVVGIYLLIGGRTYCSWVCPINPVTDAAAWLRRRLGLQKGMGLSRTTRYWMLAVALILPAVGGQLFWELVNPVTLVQRGLIFGVGLAWVVIVMVFLFDLFVSSDGWCGRLCPMGAFYSLLTPVALLRVEARQRDQCNDCLDCFKVCPEPQVIKPALKGAATGQGPTIQDINCTNCGRCVDICAPNVFEFAIHLPDKSRISL
ncbi:MAG: quinol dehydrogenase ferredoxin subunit NapH [Magnetococcales bacterium]|nr:quinol dehydrogenase ferredoxin subunit NapH [Magnetococcales bacterium]